jgi:hypothetical protein
MSFIDDLLDSFAGQGSTRSGLGSEVSDSDVPSGSGGITEREAALAIGNQLDCAPHEDISGTMFLVPNWAHKWFRHDGYVSRLLAALN